MNLRKAARRLFPICALLCLVGTIFSGCARTPPKPILPEELLKKSDIPMLEQECYELLADKVEPWVKLNNDLLQSLGREERYSAEEVTVDVTFLPYAYSFYKKTDDGRYDSYLALACSYDVRADRSAWDTAELTFYNFFLLRNPWRDKTSDTLRAEFSMQDEHFASPGWAFQESLFLYNCCTDGQSIVISEYGTGEVIRKSYDKDAAAEYVRKGGR